MKKHKKSNEDFIIEKGEKIYKDFGSEWHKDQEKIKSPSAQRTTIIRLLIVIFILCITANLGVLVYYYL